VAADATRITFGAQQVRLDFADGSAPAALPFGPRSLAEALFHHDPPTPLELEQAIDRIEDALTATRLPQASRGALVTSNPCMRTWPGLQADGASLGRDEVERLFQRLASASLGHPGALAGLPTGREAAAALLILRECMHHLGFDAIQGLAA
jgi:exopolyphosphatase/pppGpp-phosphohydrolase